MGDLVHHVHAGQGGVPVDGGGVVHQDLGHDQQPRLEQVGGADLDDLPHHLPVRFEVLYPKLQHAAVAPDAAEQDAEADDLTEAGGYRGAYDAQVEAEDQDGVQDDVHHRAGDGADGGQYRDDQRVQEELTELHAGKALPAVGIVFQSPLSGKQLGGGGEYCVGGLERGQDHPQQRIDHRNAEAEHQHVVNDLSKSGLARLHDRHLLSS